MKSITDLFIRRPVLAVVVNLIILIAGIQAIRSLTVRQYPRNENAIVTVNTVYVGASAELVRGFVTQPLELADRSGGRHRIHRILQHARPLHHHRPFEIELRRQKRPRRKSPPKVSRVRNDLPPEAEIPTIDVQTMDAPFAAAYLSFSSDILEANQITDYLTRIVQPRLSALEGVQKADLLGGRTFAMRIWMKPDRLAAYNIRPNDIRVALAANNFLSAVGHTQGFAGGGQSDGEYRRAFRPGIQKPRREAERRPARPPERCR